MRTPRQLSITLPNDMADAIRQRVASGAYASESEVVRDGLRTLFARDRAIEAWVHTEVVGAYDALVADPTAAVGVDEVRARLSARHSQQQDAPSGERVAVNVPKRRDVSSHEAMARLFAFLQAVDVDCQRDPSATAITYGENAEGAEGEFILSLIQIFDARLTAVPTAEEKLEAEQRRNSMKNESE